MNLDKISIYISLDESIWQEVETFLTNNNLKKSELVVYALLVYHKKNDIITNINFSSPIINKNITLRDKNFIKIIKYLKTCYSVKFNLLTSKAIAWFVKQKNIDKLISDAINVGNEILEEYKSEEAKEVKKDTVPKQAPYDDDERFKTVTIDTDFNMIPDLPNGTVIDYIDFKIVLNDKELTIERKKEVAYCDPRKSYIKRVSVDEAKEMIENGEATIYDFIEGSFEKFNIIDEKYQTKKVTKEEITNTKEDVIEEKKNDMTEGQGDSGQENNKQKSNKFPKTLEEMLSFNWNSI